MLVPFGRSTMKKFLFLFVGMAILVGCGGGGGGGTTGGGALTDSEQIDALVAQFIQTVEGEDAATLSTLYADAYVDDCSTKQQALALYNALFAGASNIDFTISVGTKNVNGNFATASLTTSNTYTDSNSQPQTSPPSTDTVDFAKVNGTWVMYGNQKCFNPNTYVGNYVGTWNNTTFGSTGPATFNISVDSNTSVATMVMDLDGPVFGATNPPADTLVGTYDGSGLSVTAQSPTFGPLTFTIDGAGYFNGGSTNVPGSVVRDITYAGTVSATTISLTYVITFENNTPAASGTLTATKP